MEINKEIEEFGKKLVHVSRDYTISLLLKDIKNCDTYPESVAKFLENLNKEQLLILKYLLVSCIDTAFHDTLWSIESYSNHKLFIKTEDCFIDVDHETDSLTGSALEFIDRYSKYNTPEDILKTGEIEKKPEEE